MSRSVYVASIEDGPVKIGISNNACQRMVELSCATQSKVSLAYHAECDGPAIEAIEKQTHALLHSSRSKGEWFRVTAEEAISAVIKAANQLGYELKALPIPRKTVGRPPGRNVDRPVFARLSDGVHEAVVLWSTAADVSISEAIRRLLRSHPDLKRYLGDGK